MRAFHTRALPDVPELEVQGIYGEVIMEKQQWKSRIKDQVKQILKEKPEAVYVEGDVFFDLSGCASAS